MLISSVAAVILWYVKAPGVMANIYVNSELVYSVDLSGVDEPYSLTFYGEDSYNIVTVEKGRVCVTQAGCPDQVCVRQGWISDSAAPVVCLPNRLVIRIEG